ncbi:HAD-IIIA family hydrolase [Catenuloplanes sp. NPDC051500]|uniref:HAD-IIIA family hydrolase n=1 Tax=Catenuloplanes sp. NPDC051500 TaxID=3363959 RepID=UPI0037AB8ACB
MVAGGEAGGGGPAAANEVSPAGGPATVLYDAVLFDRDGTLVVDVPYNGDPALVRPMPGARAALDRLRAAGLRLGVVTNQSGLARGRFTHAQLDAVNARVDELLGPFGTWQFCPHDERSGCRCRKPAPGLVEAAAAALGTDPRRCVVVGDIGRDMQAAAAAGAAGVLVPTEVTLAPEIAAAPAVVADIESAAELILQRIALVTPTEALVTPAGTHAVPTGTRGALAGTRGALAGTRGAPAEPGVPGVAPGVPGVAPVFPGDAPVEPGDAPVVSPKTGTVLVVRADSAGDVLVTGPAVRAVAAHAERVVLLCGPRGRAAAELLPGVDEIVEARLPWIDPEPQPVDAALVSDLTARLAAIGADQAVIFTSFHQSALPLALLLRAADVPRITAISEDYPGSLLDVRHRGVPAGVPEPERARSIAAAAGFGLPPGDDGGLRVTVPPSAAGDRPGPLPMVPADSTPMASADLAPTVPADSAPTDTPFPGSAARSYIVVHPGASVPARACPPGTMRAITAALVADGHDVRVTGGPGERDLAASVAVDGATLADSTDLAGLARLLAGAAGVVVANTGPAHLAAAVGTPVVSLFAPTVPYGQWGPYRVPHVRLGDAAAACRESRAARCPIAGHPCLSTVAPAEVLAAVRALVTRSPREMVA